MQVKAYAWRPLFTWEGRRGRRPFWILFVALSLGWSVLDALNRLTDDNPMALPVMLPASMALAVLSFCNGARRLHDIGRSAWWMLAPVPVMLVLGLATGRLQAEAPPLASLGALGACVVLIGFWAIVGSLPGDAGPNRFGEPDGSAAPDTL
jgi:uncharacterized membrane protein YhaH (DUF805 family)